MSSSSSFFSALRLQPKFADCVLKETDAITHIFTWIFNLGGIVSNITSPGDLGGWELESFLDTMCNRDTATTALLPDFLKDLRLSLGLGAASQAASASLRPEPSFSFHAGDSEEEDEEVTTDAKSPAAQ